MLDIESETFDYLMEKAQFEFDGSDTAQKSWDKGSKRLEK